MSDRTFRTRIALITLLGGLLRVLWLPSQPVSADDFLSAISAINYLESGQLGPTMWNHPGLRNILIYGSLTAFGSGLLGVKGWSLLFGILSIPLLALVCRHLLHSPQIACLAALLWAVDLLAIDYSRQAVHDIYLAFFPLAAIYWVVRFQHRQWRQPFALLAAGVCFGLGLASKWSAAFQLLACGLFLLIHTVRDHRSHPGRLAASLAFLASSLLLLPLTVYLLTFLPWFQRGYTLGEWLDLQRSMYIETTSHTGYSPERVLPQNIGHHRAIEWFVRPLVCHDDTFFIASQEGEPRVEPSLEQNMVILRGTANPLVWLLVLPGMVFLTLRGLRQRDSGLLLVAGLFVLSYLPLVVARRPIWVNTSLAVLPYALMAVAFLLWHGLSGPRRPRLLATYLGAVLLVALPLYVMVIGKGFTFAPIRDYLLADRQLRPPGSEKNTFRPSTSKEGGHGPATP